MRLMLPDERRARFVELVGAQAASLAELSRVLGRNEGYMSDYVSRKTPYDLTAHDRSRLARFLGVDPETLKPAPQRRGRAELQARRRGLNRQRSI